MEEILCFLIGCPLCLPGEDPGSERGDVAGRLRAVPRQDRGRDPAGIGHVDNRLRDQTYSMVRSRDHPHLRGHVNHPFDEITWSTSCWGRIINRLGKSRDHPFHEITRSASWWSHVMRSLDQPLITSRDQKVVTSPADDSGSTVWWDPIVNCVGEVTWLTTLPRSPDQPFDKVARLTT